MKFESKRIVTRQCGSSSGLRAVLTLGACLAAAACGLPDPPDIRTQWGRNVQQLGGLHAVYPPREVMRPGALWIADASTSLDEKNSGVGPRHITSMWMSEGVAAQMEVARKGLYSIANRRTAVGKTEDQSDKAPKRHNQPADETLEISAFPGYSLASVDQAAIGTSFPTQLARFFAGLNYNRSNSLSLEAMGVEIAELPSDVFGEVVRSACLDPASRLGRGPRRDRMEMQAYEQMAAWHQARAIDSKSGQIAAFQPQVHLIRRVFYMRGINYVYHDDKAVAAALVAALNARVPTVNTPTSVPDPGFGKTPEAKEGTPATTTAQLKQVIADLTALKTALGTSNNVGISASTGRATARGVELTHVFERPVALGYDSIVSAAIAPDGTRPMANTGVDDICATFTR